MNKERILEGVLYVRDTGLTNMFDKNMVQRIAFDNGYYETVMFIEEHTRDYVQLIMTGKFPDEIEEVA